MPDIDELFAAENALNPLEVSNPAKVVDPPSHKAINGALAKGIGVWYAAGNNAEEIGSNTTQKTIKLRTAYLRYGIVEAGDTINAIHKNPSGGAITEWQFTAALPDQITFDDSSMRQGTLGQDYTVFALTDFFFEVRKGCGRLIGASNIVTGTHADALTLAALQVDTTNTENAATVLQNLRTQAGTVIDLTSGGLLPKSITQPSLADDFSAQHFINIFPLDKELSFQHDDNLDGIGNDWTAFNGTNAVYSIAASPVAKWHHTVQKIVAAQADDGITFTSGQVQFAQGKDLTLGVQVYIPSGTHNILIKMSDGTTDFVSAQVVTAGSWQPISVSGTIAGNCSAITVKIYPNGAGTFYLDCFQGELGTSITAWVPPAHEVVFEEMKKAPDNWVFNEKFDRWSLLGTPDGWSNYGGGTISKGYSNYRFGACVPKMILADSNWYGQLTIVSDSQIEGWQGKTAYGALWFICDSTNVETDSKAQFFIADSTNISFTDYEFTDHEVNLNLYRDGLPHLVNMERSINSEAKQIVIGVRNNNGTAGVFTIQLLAGYLGKTPAKFYNVYIPPPTSTHYKYRRYLQGLAHSGVGNVYANIAGGGAGSATVGDPFFETFPAWGMRAQIFADTTNADSWAIRLYDDTGTMTLNETVTILNGYGNETAIAAPNVSNVKKGYIVSLSTDPSAQTSIAIDIIVQE